MNAHIHLIIVGCGILGIFLGGFLINLDHKGSIKDKWKCFWQPSCKYLERGIFHDPGFAIALISFLLCFTISYLLHLLSDFMWFKQ